MALRFTGILPKLVASSWLASLLILGFGSAGFAGDGHAVRGASGEWDRVGFTYHDHDSGRPDARIDLRLKGSEGASSAVLDLAVTAVDPAVEPPPGFESIGGTNVFTAQELRMLVHRQRVLHGENIALDGRAVTPGAIRIGRYEHLPVRRLRSDGSIDHHAMSETRFPISVHLETTLVGRGRHVTTWSVDGAPRLRVHVELGEGTGRITNVVRLDPPPGGRRSAGLFSFEVQPDGQPLRVPEWWDEIEWSSRDLEGRWVLLDSRLERAEDAEAIELLRFLASRREDQLIEWLAIENPRRMYRWGIEGILHAAGSDRWMRVAEWCLGSADGHTMNAAQLSLLSTHAAQTLAWFQRHPALQKKHPALFKQLAEKHEPASGVDARAPLTPEEAFPHLRRLGEVVPFGARTRVDAGQVYYHQVRREIDGLARVHGQYPEFARVLTKLLDHVDDHVRQLTWLGYTRVPTAAIPKERARGRIADGDESPAVREAALLALSYVKAHETQFELLEVALEVGHPAWRAAVSRLADIGDRFTLEILETTWLEEVRRHSVQDREFALREFARLDERTRTQEARARDEGRTAQAKQFSGWIARVLAVDALGFSRRGAFREWTIRRFAAEADRAAVVRYLERRSQQGADEARALAHEVLSALR